MEYLNVVENHAPLALHNLRPIQYPRPIANCNAQPFLSTMDAPSLFLSRLPPILVAEARLRVRHAPLLHHWKHVRVSLRGHGALVIEHLPLLRASEPNAPLHLLQVHAVEPLRSHPLRPTRSTGHPQQSHSPPIQVWGSGYTTTTTTTNTSLLQNHHHHRHHHQQQQQQHVVLDFPPQHYTVWLRALQDLTRTAPALDHFHVCHPVGKGGGGEVYLVRRRPRPHGRQQSSSSLSNDPSPKQAPYRCEHEYHKDSTLSATDTHPQPCFLAMKVVQKYAAFHSETSLQHALDERLVHQLVTDHPFIVSLHAAFQTDKAFHILTEFCSGGDLRSLLKRSPNNRLTEQEARPIFVQLALALEYLHSKNIIYRDLKPENILFSDGGDVRLTDFGLSKVLTTGRWGRTKSFCGTPGYMSPDIVRRSSPYGIASDLWSLGALLYRVLVGSGPFDVVHRSFDDSLGRKADEAEMFRRIVQDDVEYPAFLSDAARELLEGLLEKDESKRLNLEEVKESLFFSGVDWDEVLEQAESATTCRPWVKSDVSVTIDSDGSDGSTITCPSSHGVFPSLAKFELDRLNLIQFDSSELLSSKATSDAPESHLPAAVSQLKRGARRAKGLRSLWSSQPSSTDIIGFSYSSMPPSATASVE